MSTIKKIQARQIFDSRGNPTVEADVTLENGVTARAAVPSGASTGTREAVELRDGDSQQFLGKSVLKTISYVNNEIQKELLGISVFEQEKIDQMMIDLDGSENKSKLGANGILAVSLACARAGAHGQNLELYDYLRQSLSCPYYHKSYYLPAPMMNIINGGTHASNNLDIQEFMILPHLKDSFARNFQVGVEIFHHLKKVLDLKGYSTNVGDEGGFAPSFKNHHEALDCILKAAEKAGYQAGEHFSFCFDPAASEFYNEQKKKYLFEGKEITSDELIEYYQNLSHRYPVYSIEDGLSELDQASWPKLNEALGEKMLIVGDDLFVTNPKYLQRGIERHEANAILIKVNQIGTLTETFAAMRLACEHNFSSVISHRSGETADHFIADLAVATSCGHIKTGSASRSDRIEKYNQLLRIEQGLQGAGLYSYRGR